MSVRKNIIFATELILCAAVGGLLGAAGYFYKIALVPRKRDHSRDENEPAQTAGRHWVTEHVRRQDVFITSGGLQLHGNLIMASDPNCHRYAICVHGYADSAESMGIYAKRYYEEYGMNVLLPDLRGHGASEGNYVGMGYHDSRDLIRWINYIVSHDQDAVILLHGVSMGAATVCQATGKTLPQQVKAAVSDASYSNAMDEITYLYHKGGKDVIPSVLLINMLRLVTLVCARCDLGKASPAAAVSHSETPTLFIHGEDDEVVPANMMPRLFEAASCRKDFLWVPGAGHVDSVVKHPKRYWRKIENFLDSISPWILKENIRDADPFAD